MGVQINPTAVTALRERSGLSKAALAANAGIARPYLSFIESGSKQPSDEVIVKLATALRVPVTAIINAAADEVPA